MIDLGDNAILTVFTRALEDRVSIQNDHNGIGLKYIRCSSVEKHTKYCMYLGIISYTYIKCGKTSLYPSSKERKKPNQGSYWLYKWKWCV